MNIVNKLNRFNWLKFLAKLNNYFREACLDAVPQQIDTIDRQASAIYSIILPDRLAIILSVPGQPLSYHYSDCRIRSNRSIARSTVH